MPKKTAFYKGMKIFFLILWGLNRWGRPDYFYKNFFKGPFTDKSALLLFDQNFKMTKKFLNPAKHFYIFFVKYYDAGKNNTNIVLTDFI